jgi:protein-S-isoprenylcysteine O-methyltransferase Ste14
MIAGLLLSVLSKLYLNRSFGLVAANRGVKIGGPYRFVRHPMYLGYIINQLGFLIASFTLANFAIYIAAWTFQILRLREEEAILCLDPRYRQFAESVSARLIPGVY